MERRGGVLEHHERSQWEKGDLAYILEDREQDLCILTTSQIRPQQRVLQFENHVVKCTAPVYLLNVGLK